MATPDAENVNLYLSPACLEKVEDSCRRLFHHATRSGDAVDLESALMLGCEAGDEYLCEKYLEKATITENHAQREWMIEHVRKSRASNASAPTPP
ncbi:MAG: hypothetical protein H6734_15050 [Alphaproteobacteria bacterium]|nr:hypothetical protein [Alphaproteobacteria bacterium]